MLLCAISAGAASLPRRANPDPLPSRVDSTAAAVDSSSVDSIPDSYDPLRRTLISEAVPESVAASTLPVFHPKEETKSRIQRQKVDLDNVVTFSAKDSLVLVGKNSAFMYGDSEVKYGDMELQGAEIKMDMATNVVYAVGRPDSVGELQGSPVFSDKSGEYESKTMSYNFKTKRGMITDVVTEQGEGYLTGGRTKMMESGEYYLADGKYSTCDDHDNPHFYFQLTKAKVIPKKNVVTGPAYMVLAGLPLPLAVPFGYFPFSEKYSSGIIFPSFGDDYNRGFYLSNGGYYFAINDNIDLAHRRDIH